MIIAAFNPNGGVGKTTTAVNLAASLARTVRPVLLVDLEADMNASISVGVSPSDPGPSIADVLLRRRRAIDVIRPVPSVPNLHILTGAPSLTEMDERLRNVRQPERRLADVIRPLRADFESIVLDSPAGYSTLALGVPLAANHLIVPIRADYLALESLAHLLRWYRDRHAARKATAALRGILLTMVNPRRHATREIVHIIRAHNPRGVFRTEIPEDPRAAEAPSHGTPLVVGYRRTRAARAYAALATELHGRIKGPRR
jgi:chromosome partitioning protein